MQMRSIHGEVELIHSDLILSVALLPAMRVGMPMVCISASFQINGMLAQCMIELITSSRGCGLFEHFCGSRYEAWCCFPIRCGVG